MIGSRLRYYYLRIYTTNNYILLDVFLLCCIFSVKKYSEKSALFVHKADVTGNWIIFVDSVLIIVNFSCTKLTTVYYNIRKTTDKLYDWMGLEHALVDITSTS